MQDAELSKHQGDQHEADPTIEAAFNPAAIIVNFAFNMYGAVGLRAPVLLDAHDVQHKRAENARSHGGNLENRRCTRAEERNLLAMADCVFAISADDVAELEDLHSGRPVFLVPHAQDGLAVPPVTADSLRRLLFVGQNYAPNVEGIRAFIEMVWPGLKVACPEIELHVAGRVCEALKDLEGAGIFLHGQVPSLDALYDMCAIALNPAPYGTGLKIKAVEGLARGRCVVATQEGRRGVPLDAPLITVPIEGFGDAILSLIADPQGAAQMAADAAD
jgi:succinoglycan biosynthesis protein ExoO